MLTTIKRWLQLGQGEVRSSPFFDAAGGGNRLANWRPPSTNWSTALTGADLTKQRGRDLYRNDAWCRRAVTMLAHDASGASGINPQFSGPYRQQAKKLWAQFTENADLSGRYDLAGLLCQVIESTTVDGECLVRVVPASPHLRVPIQLQLIGSEFLDGSRVDAASANAIQYDADGRRRGYWLFERHPAQPGPTLRSVLVPQLGADGGVFGAVHVFEPLQPGVERGVSRLAPVALQLHELRKAMAAALVRIEVSSLLCGFAVSADGASPVNAAKNPDGSFTASLEPGSFMQVNGTSSIEFTDPPELGSTFDPFVKAQLRAISAGLGVPYELLANDVSAVTFASGKHSILSYRRRLEVLQHNVIVAQLLRPVLEAWLRLAISLGALPGNFEDYPAPRWIGPTIQALDPKADVEANISKVRAGFTSRTEIVSSEGEDVETVEAELEAENQRAKARGLVLDSCPAQTSRQGMTQQDAANEPAPAG